ncbi:MAG: thioredoxin domain-containing protein, partial [Thermodesulfobacteriaceae bacterium]|nr:thioredoxin domain-containing protein [Thermodesulfobacteriaceae bacterium]
INEVSESIIDTIKNIINKPVEDSELSEVMIHKAYETLRVSFDRNYGGFGKSPKFPLPLNMLFLHRYFYRYKNKEALDMSLQTLKKMRLGGIYDHIGFGFHRYSTDRFWILPHFEKMLYDNALLLVAYTEAYQITQEKFYKSVAEEIIKYLLRDMYSPQGVFYSSEDADSEGEEGKFYIWDYYEIMKELNSEEFEFVRRLYPIKKDGNFYDEATKQKRGKNIIYLENSIEDIAKNLKMKEIELIEKVETIRSRL